MTVAICIVCREQKFGAFVLCLECGFEPTDLADKAKSLALSDHNFPATELEKLSRSLKSGETVSIRSDYVGRYRATNRRRELLLEISPRLDRHIAL